jgi:type II secretory pathway pseudopilin PulG
MSNASSEHSQGSGNTWAIVAGILGVMFLVMLVCAGVLAALLIPAVQSARTTARRMSSSNNVKMLSLALLNYESTYRALPPAYTVDADGNRLHSWRTLLLPFMDSSGLAQKIDMSKPWNHPDNAFALDYDVPAFRSPLGNTKPGYTSYLAIVDSSTTLVGGQPTYLREMIDGMSNTIWIYETSDSKAVHWMEPTDGSIQDFQDEVTSTLPKPVPGTVCGLVDGSVTFLPDSTSPADIEAFATRDGGELVTAPAR